MQCASDFKVYFRITVVPRGDRAPDGLVCMRKRTSHTIRPPMLIVVALTPSLPGQPAKIAPAKHWRE